VTTIILIAIALLVASRLYMASAMATEHLRARLFARSYDNDPGAATAKLASPDGGTTPWSWDLRDFPEGFMSIVKPSIVAGNGITLVRLMAYSDSGLTANGTEVKTTGAIQLDNLSANGGDQAVLECSPSEVAALDTTGVGLRYLGVEITHADATDESVVTVVALPRHPRTGLTATQQA
jgi:hypothetical protein